METVPIDLFGEAGARRVAFRCRDNYSLSESRISRLLEPGDRIACAFSAPPVLPAAGTTLAFCLRASLEIFDSHASVGRHLNSLLTIRLNNTVLFDGMLHWRSHEETAAYWPCFDFLFDAALLREGGNRVEIHNRTNRADLGDFFDTGLLAVMPPETAALKLGRLYLAEAVIRHDRNAVALPRLTGIPRAAVAGSPFMLELTEALDALPPPPWRWLRIENAEIADRGDACEFGCRRRLWAVTPLRPGRPVRLELAVGDRRCAAGVEAVYARLGNRELVVGPGAETTYWHRLPEAVRDGFELNQGNAVRISIDDYLNNLHAIPAEKWLPLIDYLVRRERFFALQRIRVPPTSRVLPEHLGQWADRGGAWFAGISVTEPILHLARGDAFGGDLAERLRDYLATFRERMAAVRLPGHRLVTFDSAGPMCGHYYQAGLDEHLAEVGPACNVLEESCCRGAATAFGKPWGIACAMHWYCGQGAQYACDPSRVRLARLVMQSAYLAGARQILWEGGVFDNLPVYNFMLSEESRRDYERDYHHPVLQSLRAEFGAVLDLHRAQQLPPPTVRQAVLRGVNDLFHGTYEPVTSRLGDFSMARAWTLLKVFLPHFSFGRSGIDHGRRARRWYSATPRGAVDVAPAEAPLAALQRYAALYLTGWNTMTDALYEKLLAYVNDGGRLFLALPHLTADTVQSLEWRFREGGDARALCGIRIRGLGGRIESVRFLDDRWSTQLPATFNVTHRNPLWIEDYDEVYPVFSQDITCFGGALELAGAQPVAVSQSGEPVLLQHRVGAGTVTLLNSWAHPGRGRLLDLAAGVMAVLADEVPAAVRIDDPSERLAWFAYPAPEGHRLMLLNTDWTAAGGAIAVTVRTAEQTFPVNVREGQPVQIRIGPRGALVIHDPRIQVLDWSDDGEAVRVTVAGPDPHRPGLFQHHAAAQRRLVVNGVPADGRET